MWTDEKTTEFLNTIKAYWGEVHPDLLRLWADEFDRYPPDLAMKALRRAKTEEEFPRLPTFRRVREFLRELLPAEPSTADTEAPAKAESYEGELGELVRICRDGECDLRIDINGRQYLPKRDGLLIRPEPNRMVWASWKDVPSETVSAILVEARRRMEERKAARARNAARAKRK